MKIFKNILKFIVVLGFIGLLSVDTYYNWLNIKYLVIHDGGITDQHNEMYNHDDNLHDEKCFES